MYFFTADPHFNHANIIKYCDRPFKDVLEMDRELIKNFNSVVGDKDTLFVVGDFCLNRENRRNYYRDILSKLNGIKILILGNHDPLKPFAYVDLGFQSVHTMLELTLDSSVGSVILHHDPAISVINKNQLFFCGHIHNLFKLQKNVLNVGVDVWDYTPVSEKEVLEFLNIHSSSE